MAFWGGRGRALGGVQGRGAWTESVQKWRCCVFINGEMPMIPARYIDRCGANLMDTNLLARCGQMIGCTMTEMGLGRLEIISRACETRETLTCCRLPWRAFYFAQPPIRNLPSFS